MAKLFSTLLAIFAFVILAAAFFHFQPGLGAKIFNTYKNIKIPTIASLQTTTPIITPISAQPQNQSSGTTVPTTQAQSPSEFSFAFGGDMMFDRLIESHFQGNNFYQIMDNLDPTIFGNKDISMVNLEGPISATPTTPDDDMSLVFNFPPATVDVMKAMGLNAAGLANNHSLNQGQSGLENTKSVLANKNITPVGQDRSIDASSIKEFSANGIKVAIIAVDSLDTVLDPNLIRQEKSKGYRVIVFPHWGVEYQDTHNATQASLAHQWIDAGADLIIGSHPHVVEDVEIYKNRPIVYSLGNLLFDQTFSDDTQHGLIVTGEFTSTDLELDFQPTVQIHLKPQLQSATQKQGTLVKILGNIQPVTNDNTIEKKYDKIILHNIFD